MDIDLDQMTTPAHAEQDDTLPFDSKKVGGKCCVCSKTENLHACRSCALVVYCSTDCQKADWKQHKLSCVETHPINLKTFHPFIAYLFESVRLSKPGRHDSVTSVHPAFRHKIIQAPVPLPLGVTNSENLLHHTVFLGKETTCRDVLASGKWIRKSVAPTKSDETRFYYHFLRELFNFELTVAITLTLLGELCPPPSVPIKQDNTPSDSKKPTFFRFEYGRIPISDFGICKGRIEDKFNKVQTWTYYDTESDTRTMINDPDNHYWIYFRTILGEELFLDCCSFSFGMGTCVDASACLNGLSEDSKVSGSIRVPAYFVTPKTREQLPYTLIPEKRFSVMDNTVLHHALTVGTSDQPRRQRETIKDFMSTVLGEKCTDVQHEVVLGYLISGGTSMNQVLTAKHWLKWRKSTLHTKDFWQEENWAQRWKKGAGRSSGRHIHGAASGRIYDAARQRASFW